MKIEIYEDYMLMSQRAAQLIVEETAKKPDTLLCAASGNSTLGAYKLLPSLFLEMKVIYNNLRIFKLDEWGGIPIDHPQSCENYLQENLIKPLEISSSRYFSFQAEPKLKGKECIRLQCILRQKGPIGVSMLGLGINGHLGFNEPGDFLNPNCHFEKLSKSSLSHSMARKMERPPSFGLSIGMADILQSQKIILMVTGKNKNKIVQQLLTEKITTQLPASFLWLHSNTTCLINKEDIQIPTL